LTAALAIAIAALLASHSGSAVAESAANPARQPLEMHRSHAGTGDGTGWFSAVSTNGGFKVSLPATFNDFTIRVDDPNIGELVTDSLGTEIEGAKVLISLLHGTEKSKAVTLDGMIANLKAAPMGPDIASVEKASIDGLPAVSLTVKGKERMAYLRYLIDGKDLYFVSVECLVSLETKCDAVRDKVYATFSRK
jgi:hypothetical protein